jgi:hypothetical protein
MAVRALHEKRCQLVRARRAQGRAGARCGRRDREQRQQVEAILERTFNDLKGLHRRPRAAHSRRCRPHRRRHHRSAIEAPGSSTLPAGAGLRVVADAIGDAEVLTPSADEAREPAREHFE